MPLTGLRSYPLATNPGSIIQAGIAGWDQGQEDQRKAIADARQRLLMLTEKEDLAEKMRVSAERARTPQSLTLGAPAVPGIAAGPNAAPPGGGQLLSLEEAPQGISRGVPAASETLTEFPRHETPLQFDTRRRQEQSRVYAKQADAEALDRWDAGDYVGYHNARARSYGHWMDAEPQHRSALMEKRNDALNKGVELRKQGVTRSETAPKLLGFFKELEADPLNRVPYWKAMELIATSDDPEIQRQGHEWLQNDLKAYKARRIMTEQGLAIGKVEEMLLRKQVERGDKKVLLDDAEYRKIGLEVIQALPNEVAVYNEAILSGKGTVPGMFMRLFNPQLSTPKEIQWEQRAMQEARAELGPDASAADVRALADSKYSMFKGGQTPAAQKSKQDLQAAQAERARASADVLERKAMQEAGVGGGINMARVTPGTMKGITSAIKDIDATMAAIRNDATKSQQEKDQEVMTWEQSKTRLHGLLDRISQAQLVRPSGAAAPAVSASRPAAATVPGQPSQATADWIRRAKKLYDDDRTPGKGSWNDEAVQLKYGRLAKRQQTP